MFCPVEDVMSAAAILQRTKLLYVRSNILSHAVLASLAEQDDASAMK
ncbi:hypothetical protein CFter6_0781 [Collimonas fungivorans]|uniref:Uncharacterized protein n=1 Tax=Collimonas fungivorans TaxID=158899 RepID=A0A127P6R8_9BURK|nr:hypothetical protein CFter6_0781 [Collimonas fungivorans]